MRKRGVHPGLLPYTQGTDDRTSSLHRLHSPRHSAVIISKLRIRIIYMETKIEHKIEMKLSLCDTNKIKKPKRNWTENQKERRLTYYKNVV